VAALAAWSFLVAPAGEAAGSPLLVEFGLLVHFPMSVFLISVALYLSYGRVQVASTWAGIAILAAFPALAAGHVLYLLGEVGIVERNHSTQDVLYCAAFVLFGSSFLHPSIRTVMDEHKKPARSSTARLTVVMVALATPVVVLVTQPMAHTSSRVAAGVLALALLGAAVLRLLRTLISSDRERTALVHRADHDHLTGLANRAQAEAKLELELSERAKTGEPLTMMFLDLDKFKAVNDTLGHAGGDELIVGVAQRLLRSVPARVLVARLGGDEFLLVAPSTDREEAAVMAEGIRRKLREPFELSAGDVTTAATIGVAVADRQDEEVNPSVLTQSADLALYRAKELGRNRVEFYDQRLEAEAERKRVVASSLVGAGERGELTLAYQPMVRGGDESLHGAEALLRWEHPELGAVSPAELVAVAEETGMIVEVGRWVLETACAQLSSWRERGLTMQVSVNVSARQFMEEGFVEEVQALLDKHELVGELLDLELTESLLVLDRSGVAATLERLRALGVSLSVDDFGTGYSSLAHLQKFPVNRVKIDQAFVADLSTKTSKTSLVPAIVAMATALGLETVAEGVETRQDQVVLEALGCTYLQGYLFSKPLAVGDFEERFGVEPLLVREPASKP
jgi:diguanylate cyclase (GGDEF)-like protein